MRDSSYIQKFTLYSWVKKMENLNEEQLELLKRFKTKGLDAAWDAASDELKRYKCNNCKMIVWETPCPNCGTVGIDKMCPADHCHCSHEVVEGFSFCEICEEPICPKCNSHNVQILSRITGYIQPFNGWNAAKVAEFKDRKRYDV